MAIDPRSEEAIAAITEEYRVPTRAEITALMHRFFVPPIRADVIDRLEAELHAALDDSSKHSILGSQFVSNRRRYLGQAWREVLSPHRNSPTPKELAVWIAVLGKGYPSPMPYCPPEFVGSWRQTLPEAATWRLASDGSMETGDSRFSERTKWCVHRGDFPTASFVDNDLWFTGPRNPIPLSVVIVEVTPSLLRAMYYGSDEPVEYRLERVE